MGKSAEIEVFDKNGKHLGAIDPITGEFIENSQVEGRVLKRKYR